jgi:hypothetical protein
VSEYDDEFQIMRGPWRTRGCCVMVKQKDTNAHHTDMMEGAKRSYILRSVENSEDFLFFLLLLFSSLRIRQFNSFTGFKIPSTVVFLPANVK